MPEADSQVVRLRRIIEVWQPYSKEPLTLADAEEILWSVGGFFDTLAKIDAEAKSNPDKCVPHPPASRILSPKKKCSLKKL